MRDVERVQQVAEHTLVVDTWPTAVAAEQACDVDGAVDAGSDAAGVPESPG